MVKSTLAKGNLVNLTSLYLSNIYVGSAAEKALKSRYPHALKALGNSGNLLGLGHGSHAEFY